MGKVDDDEVICLSGVSSGLQIYIGCVFVRFGGTL